MVSVEPGEIKTGIYHCFLLKVFKNNHNQTTNTKYQGKDGSMGEGRQKRDITNVWEGKQMAHGDCRTRVNKAELRPQSELFIRREPVVPADSGNARKAATTKPLKAGVSSRAGNRVDDKSVQGVVRTLRILFCSW